jgi:hypothetical protein
LGVRSGKPVLKGGNVKRKIQYRCSEEATASLPGVSAILVALIAGFLVFGCGKEQKALPQAPIVEVVEVIQKDVPVYGSGYT